MAPNNAHPNCHEFVAAVEELLERRTNERKLERLTDFYEEFPSYVDTRVGKKQNLPPRSEVMRIADYLQCTLRERNRLLSAAGYAIVEDYIEGDLLDRSLETGKKIVDRDYHDL